MYRFGVVLVAVALVTVGCEKEKPSAAQQATEPAVGQPVPGQAEAPEKPSKVDGTKARELVSSGAILLDVRTQGEFDSGHIDGAKLIPVQELSGRVDDVGAKDKTVVIYCASGMRSARAANMLAEAGYVDVYDLGAMRNW